MNRVGNLLSPFIKSLGIEGALQLEEIRREWTNVFQEPLSLHVAPAALQNGSLLIYVDSPVWLQQISLYKSDIVQKLRPFGVQDVRLRMGKMRSEKKSQRPDRGGTPEIPLDRDTLEYIHNAVSSIGDQELRGGIKRAMEKAFMRQIERGRGTNTKE